MIITKFLSRRDNDYIILPDKSKTHNFAFRFSTDIVKKIAVKVIYGRCLFENKSNELKVCIKDKIEQHVNKIKTLANSFLSKFINDNYVLHSLFFNSDDAMYVINPISLKIIACNRIAFRRLQYTYDEVMGMKFPQIDDSSGVIEKWNEIVEQVVREKSITIESTHYRKDGALIPVEVNMSIGNYNGSERLVAIVRDLRLRVIDKEKLWIEANIDPLTRLPNRRIFKDKLNKILDEKINASVFIVMFYIDIDHFKKLNDTLGHAVGDEVLVTIAKRLKNSTREDDCIARFGGDEFVVVFTDLKNSAISALTNKIMNVFSERVKTKDYLLNVNASIGVGRFNTQNLELEREINLVDKAMYQAKKINGTSIYYHLEDNDFNHR